MKTRNVCTRLPRYTALFPLLVAIATLIGVVSPAFSQEGQPSKEEEQLRGKVSEALSKGDAAVADKMLWEMLQKKAAAPGAAAVSGSVFFEEIRGCGFYPQETRLECVIDIKQNGGYAGPIETFGSTEHVYFCVDWNNSGTFDQTESVGQGSVVMHDGSARTSYAVYRDIDIPGTFRTRTVGAGAAQTITTAPILNAQATLSWVTPPTGCNFSPIWGNVFRFRIRLNPIR